MTHENKLGLFIHWGPYASFALHEQAQARYGIAREEYEKAAMRFDPAEYDPEKWVIMAKEAGMKYICFTAKHHDGFCMWDTKYTTYNIMNTPYKKDVLKMLADACEKHGIALSIYYSLPDWHHEHGYNPLSTHQWCAKNKENSDFEIYKKYVKAQITELLSNYGKIYTLFWDIPPKIEDSSFNELARSLQPGIFINNRGFDAGDFSTPEREYDASGNPEQYPSMVESCNSLSALSWGYRSNDDFYSQKYILRSICKTMAKGGSFLINVGPDEKGLIDPEQEQRINAIGRWYRSTEGVLECHEADTFDYRMRGAGECIPIKKNGKSYFVFCDGTVSTGVICLSYPSIPKKVRLLNTDTELDVTLELLPCHTDPASGIAKEKCLHIRNIPIDALPSEPIIIEINY